MLVTIVNILSLHLLLAPAASAGYCGPIANANNFAYDVRQNGGICYQFVDAERFWDEGRAYCQANGGELVTIDSADKQQFIAASLNSLTSWTNKGVWIGLNDLNIRYLWTWPSGAPSMYRNWADGEPSKPWWQPFDEDCAVMRREYNWQWHSYPCHHWQWTYKFICEYPELTTTAPSTAASTSMSSLLSSLVVSQRQSATPDATAASTTAAGVPAGLGLVVRPTAVAITTDMQVPRRLTDDQPAAQSSNALLVGIVVAVGLLVLIAVLVGLLIRRRLNGGFGRRESSDNMSNLAKTVSEPGKVVLGPVYTGNEYHVVNVPAAQPLPRKTVVVCGTSDCVDLKCAAPPDAGDYVFVGSVLRTDPSDDHTYATIDELDLEPKA